jgi:hypothetical protein
MKEQVPPMASNTGQGKILRPTEADTHTKKKPSGGGAQRSAVRVIDDGFWKAICIEFIAIRASSPLARSTPRDLARAPEDWNPAAIDRTTTGTFPALERKSPELGHGAKV